MEFVLRQGWNIPCLSSPAKCKPQERKSGPPFLSGKTYVAESKLIMFLRSFSFSRPRRALPALSPCEELMIIFAQSTNLLKSSLSLNGEFGASLATDRLLKNSLPSKIRTMTLEVHCRPLVLTTGRSSITSGES